MEISIIQDFIKTLRHCKLSVIIYGGHFAVHALLIALGEGTLSQLYHELHPEMAGGSSGIPICG